MLRTRLFLSVLLNDAFLDVLTDVKPELPQLFLVVRVLVLRLDLELAQLFAERLLAHVNLLRFLELALQLGLLELELFLELLVDLLVDVGLLAQVVDVGAELAVLSHGFVVLLQLPGQEVLVLLDLRLDGAVYLGLFGSSLVARLLGGSWGGIDSDVMVLPH